MRIREDPGRTRRARIDRATPAVGSPRLDYVRCNVVPPFSERNTDGVDCSDQHDQEQAGQQAVLNEILAALIAAKPTKVNGHRLSRSAAAMKTSGVL
jgi:hypothetical protein